MQSTTGRLVFMRHGQSADNAAGVFANRPPGTGLTDAGRRQAAAAVDRLPDEPVAAVYASTALRAIETATVVANATGAAVTTSAALLEYDFGIFDGSSDPAVGVIARDVLERWVVKNDLSAHLPDGETGADVIGRFLRAVGEISYRHPGRTIVVVCHGGLLTVGLPNLCDNLTADDVWDKPLGHCVPVTVEQTDGGWWCAGWPGRPGSV